MAASSQDQAEGCPPEVVFAVITLRRVAAEPDSYSDEKLDQLTDELFAELRGDGSDQRSGADFLLNPEHLPLGSVRHYFHGYLEWLGIPDEVLPRSRVY